RIRTVHDAVMIRTQQCKIAQRILAAAAEPDNVMRFADRIATTSRAGPTDKSIIETHFLCEPCGPCANPPAPNPRPGASTADKTEAERREQIAKEVPSQVRHSGRQ